MSLSHKSNASDLRVSHDANPTGTNFQNAVFSPKGLNGLKARPSQGCSPSDTPSHATSRAICFRGHAIHLSAIVLRRRPWQEDRLTQFYVFYVPENCGHGYQTLEGS